MSEDVVKLSLLILGFDETDNPSETELSKAFQKLSLKFHPDAGGTSNTFRGLTLAKETVASAFKAPAPSRQTTYNPPYQYGFYDSNRETTDLKVENKELATKVVNYLVLLGLTNLKSITIKFSFGDCLIKIKNEEAISIHYKYIGHLESWELNMYNSMLKYMLNHTIGEIFNNLHEYRNTYTFNIRYVRLSTFERSLKGALQLWRKLRKKK